MPHAIIPSTPRLAGGVLGLAAFALAIASALLRQADAGTALRSALLAMLVCYLLGLALGKVGEHVVREHVAAHKTRNPRPEKPQRLRDLEARLNRPEAGELGASGSEAAKSKGSGSDLRRSGPRSGGQPVETSRSAPADAKMKAGA